MERRTLAAKSPTCYVSSSESSEFEFRISISPRESSATADELFYKGQLLPLSLSLVRSLLAPSSTSSSSARPSSADSSHSLFTDECHDNFLRRPIKKKFSPSRFSAVFRKKEAAKSRDAASSIKRMSSSVKKVMRKYLNKVKPLYAKISQKHQKKMSAITVRATSSTDLSLLPKTYVESTNESDTREENNGTCLPHSFPGNLGYPRKNSFGFSCPSSMRSSPSHSGILYRNTFPSPNRGKDTCYTDTWSVEELQSAIQSAIAHCKNSMVQDKGIGTRLEP